MTDTIAEPKSATVDNTPSPTNKADRRGRKSDTAVIVVQGDLDVTHVPELHKQIARALGTLDRGCLILDLRKTAFLSLRVAGELVKVKHRAAPRGIDVRLVFQDPAVQRALDVTGAFLLFPAYPSIEAAERRILPPT